MCPGAFANKNVLLPGLWFPERKISCWTLSLSKHLHCSGVVREEERGAGVTFDADRLKQCNQKMSLLCPAYSCKLIDNKPGVLDADEVGWVVHCWVSGAKAIATTKKDCIGWKRSSSSLEAGICVGWKANLTMQWIRWAIRACHLWGQVATIGACHLYGQVAAKIVVRWANSAQISVAL